MNRFRALAAVAIAASVGACDESVTAPDGLVNRDFRWVGSLAPNATVEIRGVNGSIRARRNPGRQVVVSARIEGNRAQVSEIRVEAVRHADGVTVCARYPDRTGELIPCHPDGDGRADLRPSNVRVEFTIEVPDSVTFVGSTVNGAVTAANLRADASATTVNGSIDIVTDGIAEASTVNGSIAAAVGETNWGRALRFSTVNGSIRVAIRRDADVQVRGSTMNGRIATDFPLSITQAGFTRQMRGSLGSGTWNLLLSTVNGDIALREHR